MSRCILFLTMLISFSSFAQVVEEIRLNSQDSVRFFKRLKHLATAVSVNQYRLDFASKGGAFRMYCDAAIISPTETKASCQAVFDMRLSSPETQMAFGKAPNVIYAKFNDRADNMSLAAIRSSTSSGIGTLEKKILAYTPAPLKAPRFGINCDKAADWGYSCYAVSVKDCTTAQCGKQ